MSNPRDPFVSAMRAEIEAIVARYEALVRSHQEALAAARESEVAKLKQDLATASQNLSTMLADRERAKALEADLRGQIKAQTARADRLDADLREARALADRERAAGQEAQARLRELADEARRQADEAREEARRKIEAAREEARRQIEAAKAEAQKQLAQVEGELRSAQQEAESLSGAFASERAFLDACRGLDGSGLLDAIRSAFGAELVANPTTYAALKERRLDNVLSLALKERGRLVVAIPLQDRERAALRGLAEAAGCELIAPEHGVRFSASSMDKASTTPDPAEEGNVLECLLPGLRLAGSDGSLVFPRVLVATG